MLVCCRRSATATACRSSRWQAAHRHTRCIKASPAQQRRLRQSRLAHSQAAASPAGDQSAPIQPPEAAIASADSHTIFVASASSVAGRMWFQPFMGNFDVDTASRNHSSRSWRCTEVGRGSKCTSDCRSPGWYCKAAKALVVTDVDEHSGLFTRCVCKGLFRVSHSELLAPPVFHRPWTMSFANREFLAFGQL